MGEYFGWYVGECMAVLCFLGAYRAPSGVSKQSLSTKCLFPNCKTKVYAYYTRHTTHLRKAHGLTVEQYSQRMPEMDDLQRRHVVLVLHDGTQTGRQTDERMMQLIFYIHTERIPIKYISLGW